MKVICLLLLFAIYSCHYSEDEINRIVDDKVITCGSALRIQNVMTKFHLHSHKLTWGTGSGQQSVTGMQNSDDHNSLWYIKEDTNTNACITGTPIKCGQFIRLEHVNTGKNLHSHNYNSWVTDSQEVKYKILFES